MVGGRNCLEQSINAYCIRATAQPQGKTRSYRLLRFARSWKRAKNGPQREHLDKRPRKLVAKLERSWLSMRRALLSRTRPLVGGLETMYTPLIKRDQYARYGELFVGSLYVNYIRAKRRYIIAWVVYS